MKENVAILDAVVWLLWWRFFGNFHHVLIRIGLYMVIIFRKIGHHTVTIFKGIWRQKKAKICRHEMPLFCFLFFTTFWSFLVAMCGKKTEVICLWSFSVAMRGKVLKESWWCLLMIAMKSRKTLRLWLSKFLSPCFECFWVICDYQNFYRHISLVYCVCMAMH